jgi:hypothetical protein
MDEKELIITTAIEILIARSSQIGGTDPKPIGEYFKALVLKIKEAMDSLKQKP